LMILEEKRIWIFIVIIFVGWFKVTVVIAHDIVTQALSCFEGELDSDCVLACGIVPLSCWM
jgi:hypothetical protein